MLNNPKVVPESVPGFGLAIAINQNWSHTGLIYRKEGLATHLLHHVGDKKTECKLFKEGKYFWCMFQHIDQDVIETFSEWVSIYLAANKNKLPYSVIYDGPGVYLEGVYHSENPEDGFTCATFLVELFELYKIELFDRDTWPKGRSDDVAYFRAMLSEPGRGPSLPVERKNAQLLAVNDVQRFSPVHLAVAPSLFRGHRLSFVEVDEKSQLLAAYLGKSPTHSKDKNDL